MEPTADRNRIVLLDVLRGVAVFGMFTVNMSADLPWGSAFRVQPLDIADGATMIVIDLLANGKFVTIFSFLFGVGFFLQLERARAEEAPFLAAYLRRLMALFVIAILAMIAGLGTHILIDYSMFGLLLLLLWRLSTRFLLAGAIVCFLIGVVSSNIEVASDLRRSEGSQQVELVDAESSAQPSTESERDRIYREGSFMEIASYRAFTLPEYLFSWRQRLWDAPLLGLMLLGGCVCRSRVLRDSSARTRMARTALPWALVIGGAGMVTAVWVSHFADADSDLLTLIGELAFWPFGAPVLGLGYVALMALLWEKKAWRRLMLPFSHVGRLALTNYLFHALVIAAFTYQWGLGLYDQMGPFWGLMSVFAIFPLMVIASSWWIARFRFGPIEWVWRTLTYGEIQSPARH